MSENYFAELYGVDVSDKIEKKNKLSYLSWAWAWAELKKKHPDAFFTVYENKDGWNYHTDGRTAWVKTGVTVKGLEHIEYLPVMNCQNKSIPYASVTSYDVNKSIQRSLTKAIGRHGLGLCLYAGEDLPDEASTEVAPPAPKQTPADVEKAEKEFFAKFNELNNKLSTYLNKKGMFDRPDVVRQFVAAKDIKKMEAAVAQAEQREAEQKKKEEQKKQAEQEAKPEQLPIF